jgi:hypothetical protein
MDSDWSDIRCSSLEEARWFRSVLEAASIEALIRDEHTLALPLDGTTQPDDVRLLVRAADLEKALDAIDAAGGSGRA